MKLFTVTFDDSNEVVVERGLPVEDEAGNRFVDLGTDVGGATLAMIPFRIPLLGVDAVDDGGTRRVLVAAPEIGEEGEISFVPEGDAADGRAFVVLSVIQRSPDARTEFAPLADGVECIGNAYDRPMDTQVLLMTPVSNVQFRRFGRGGQFGPWHTLNWDGNEIGVSVAHESAS